MALARPLLRLPAATAALAAGLLWLVFAPPTPDLAAQVYRAGLFAETGYAIWDGQWYGGHHMPGYSLLFPPLGALLGVRVLGLAAAVAAALLFDRLAEAHFGPRARAGAIWLGLATACDLLIGRLTFGLGVAVGLGALLALQRGRPRLAAALALACAAASPVAALFLALAGIALWLASVPAPPRLTPAAIARSLRAGRRAHLLTLTVPALGLVVALALAFPEGGRQPFGLLEAAFVLLSAAAVGLLLPPRERVLRIGAGLYALAAIAAYLLPTPMGSNAARLGATFAGPLVVCALGRRAARPAVLAILIPLALWQWWPPVREVAKGTGDPSAQAGYYAPLIAFLEEQPGGPMRIEVPFTRLHWEAVHLARRFPLARGWETQLDTKYHALFYEGEERLDPERYRRWLAHNGVRFVAVPDAPLDPTAQAEAALVATTPAYLRPVWRSEDWRVYAVRDATGLVDGPGRLTQLDGEGFTLRADAPGTLLVRVRHTPYWEVTGGAGCVEASADGDWTSVTMPAVGSVRVEARLALPTGKRCQPRP